MKLLLPCLVLFGALVAGCTGSGDTRSPPSGSPSASLQALAQGVPPLDFDAKAAVDWWSAFSTTYTSRNAYLPGNDAARDHIAGTLGAAGFKVQVLQYAAEAQGRPLPDGVPARINVVEATRQGTGPGVIAFGAHYDNFYIANPPKASDATGDPVALAAPTALPIQAAYDNGAGTATVVQLCAAMAKVPLRHTLACLLFDGEELGTLGSQAYAADGRHERPQLYVGFDMTGLNWPGIDTAQAGRGLWKLYAWTGPEFADQLFPLVNGTLHDVLGYPLLGAEAFPMNDRNSDEASFAEAHVPTIRFAGGRTAGLYPQYHRPGDTVDFVYQLAGGRANFEAGMAAVAQTAYQVTMELDQTDLAQLKAEPT
ncbi:MAG TPA: M28 family peptidase [Candidatus Thermoplasmatota archaeon]|nr:M28 family peptidase [Candidatus Thermoplasmatota archaeon]